MAGCLVATLAVLLVASCATTRVHGPAPATQAKATRSDGSPDTTRADSLFDQCDYLAATSAYVERMARRKRSVPHSVLRLGLCWERLGRSDQALTHYELLVQSAPGSPDRQGADGEAAPPRGVELRCGSQTRKDHRLTPCRRVQRR